MTPPRKDPLTRVRRLALALSDVEEGTAYGFPVFKVGGGTFAWLPKRKDVEPGTLGASVSIIEREHRIAHAPDVYYVTPHYQDYAVVLARVDLMTDASLRELLESAREFMVVSDKAKRRKRKSR